ncbi:MAG TPA: magnesium transporter [Tepidisphaeraceae bacterium]|jgi:magnesium transporter|nr:magnesium transporter [Tepidisphaeraceae bacterium]
MSDELLQEIQGHPYDPREIADQLKNMGAEESAVALELLPVKVAAAAAQNVGAHPAGEIFRRMEPARAAKVISAMTPEIASAVLSAMAPDDRVDLLGYLNRDVHDALLRGLGASQAAEARELEQYPPDTAGGIMTTQVTALLQDFTVEKAIAELRRIHEELGQMYYVYVVDEQRRLVGVLSMRNLILAKPDSSLGQIMIPGVRSVPATMDQEEVARQMRSSRFLALPVVDANQHLCGLITLDDVIDVIQEEATEDVQRMFGAGAEERLNSSWQFSFSKRIWWLQVNLGTAFLAALVVSMFGGIISRLSVLAFFIPVVSSMGSNAGAQAMSVAIRGITHGRTDRKLLHHVLARETIVGLLSGVVIGITTAIIAMIWQFHHGLVLGAVVGAAIILTQTLACVSGAAIPFVMRRLGFDPAQSATIFATTITDVAGFASLLGLATICAGWMR